MKKKKKKHSPKNRIQHAWIMFAFGILQFIHGYLNVTGIFNNNILGTIQILTGLLMTWFFIYVLKTQKEYIEHFHISEQFAFPISTDRSIIQSETENLTYKISVVDLDFVNRSYMLLTYMTATAIFLFVLVEEIKTYIFVSVLLVILTLLWFNIKHHLKIKNKYRPKTN